MFICILSILLKRLFQMEYYRSSKLTEALEEIAKSKLVRYRIRNYSPDKEEFTELCSVTLPSRKQKISFEMSVFKNRWHSKIFSGELKFFWRGAKKSAILRLELCNQCRKRAKFKMIFNSILIPSAL